VDGAEREQLREWAGALVAGGGDERRSSGRAILMLLDRIDELERELAGRGGSRPSGPPPDQPPPEPLPEVEPPEDTQPIGLRDRLRLATGRLHER